MTRAGVDLESLRRQWDEFGLRRLPSGSRPSCQADPCDPGDTTFLSPVRADRAAHFSGVVNRHGALPQALAGYNAGDSRGSRWMGERVGLPPDGFTEDIPLPGMRNRVKRIPGTAEDHRRRHGTAKDTGAAPSPVVPGRR